jgi:flagellar hook-length control protein FliK
MAQLLQWSLHDPLQIGVARMEALPSLPPELVAFAAPLTRGPAPLLGSGVAEPATDDVALPFDLYLALMTPPLPTGEAWPASGKDLPVATAVAAPAPPAAPLAAASAGDAALLARLSLATADASAQPPGAETLPVLNGAELEQPLSPSGPQTGATLAEAAPQTATSADPAAATAVELADALRYETAELEARSTSADNADATNTLELPAAPDARATRPQPAAAEPRFAVPTEARSALGARDARSLEAFASTREGAAQLEVTSLSQTLPPAVAEMGHAGPEWLTSPHAATSTAPGAAQGTGSTAAAGAAVDLRAPNWQEAFASRVQWLAGGNGGEARITLNPPELGAVDVKVSLVDDKTYVQLTTATVAARDELSQSLPRLRELFAASGIELGGASVHDGGHGNRGGQGGGDRAWAATPESRTLAPLAALADEPPVAAAPRRSLGRVDVFA